MRTIAVVNQKGGVGKTTTVANLGHALALAGKQVTAIDLDPQGHLGASLGLKETTIPGIDRVLDQTLTIDDAVVPVREGLRLVPAGPNLATLELASHDCGAAAGYRLSHALEGRFQDQDFVLLDCPPASGLLVMNALLATQSVLVPVVGDYLGLRGLAHLLGTIRRVEQGVRRRFQQMIAVTRFHPRRRLAQEVCDKLLEHLGGQVFLTPIRETVALAECPSFGLTIFEYSARSNGARDYSALAADLLGGRMK